MIPRTALAVVLAVALVGVALPAVDSARVGATDRAVAGEVERVERAAVSLVERDEAAPTAGARRVVVVRLPHESWGREGLAYLSLGGTPGGGPPPGWDGGGEDGAAWVARGVVAYRIDGRPARVSRLAVPLVSPGGPLVLREPGTHRVALELDRRGNRTVVVASRADPPPGIYPGAGDHPVP